MPKHLPARVFLPSLFACLLASLAVLCAASCVSKVPETESMFLRNDKLRTALRDFPSRNTVPINQTIVAPDADLPAAADPDLRTGTLANGLSWKVLPAARGSGKVSLRLVVNAGSIQEEDSQRGLAHFLEHMAFNGTTHFAPGFLIKENSQGAVQVNGHTSYDHTWYQVDLVKVDAASLEQSFLILQDFACGQLLAPEEVEQERPVVLQEKMMRRGSDLPPPLPAPETDGRLPSRYDARDPIGTEDVLKAATAADLRRFRDAWYRPNLMTVVIVGDVDPGDAIARIQANFGPSVAGLESGKDAQRTWYDYTLRSTSKARLYGYGIKDMVLFHVNRTEAFRYDGSCRDLYRSFMAALAGEAFLIRLEGLKGASRTGYLDCYASWDMISRYESRTFGARFQTTEPLAAGRAFMEELERIRRYGFTAGELERARRVVQTRMQRDIEQAGAVDVEKLADSVVQAVKDGSPVLSPAENARRGLPFLQGVSLDALNAFVPSWFNDDCMELVVESSVVQGTAMASWYLDDYAKVREGELARPVEAAFAPVPAAASPVTAGTIVREETAPGPGIKTWTLSNGIRVLFTKTNHSPGELQWYFVGPGGTACLPDDLVENGLLAPQLSTQLPLVAPSLKEQEEFCRQKGITFQTIMGQTTEGFMGSCRSTSLPILFDMICGLCVKPAFTEAMFDEAYNQIAATVEQNQYYLSTLRDNIQARGDLRKLPLTPETVQRFGFEEVCKVWADRFGDCGDFVLSLAGDFDEAELRSLVEDRIAGLPASGRVDHPRALPWSNPALDEEASSPQSSGGASYVLMSRTAELDDGNNSLALLLCIRALAQSQVQAGIREDLGLSYGMQVEVSYMDFQHDSVRWNLLFDCKPGRELQARTRVKAILSGLAAAPLPEAEFNAFIQEMAKGLDPVEKSNAAIAEIMLGLALKGSPVDGYTSPLTSLKSLDSAGLQAAAKAFFDGPGWVETYISN